MTETELKKMFRCIYCDKQFVRESWFNRHLCDKKKKFNRATNLDQIRALKLYNYWSRLNGFLKRGREVSMETFHKSAYAKLFLDLVEFTNANWTVTPFKFLHWLIDSNVPSHLWCTERTLKNYRDWIVVHDEPMKQVKNTAHFIREWCRDRDMPINTFFAKVGLGDAMHLIETYKLSPWVLLGYDVSVVQLLDRFDHEQTLLIDERISLSHWIGLIEQQTNLRDTINTWCADAFREGQ